MSTPTGSSSTGLDRQDGAPGLNRPAARATGTQAVERALLVLSSFIRSEPELGITDLSRSLGLSPSTVHRLVRALVAHGFLEQNDRTERYGLGRNLLLLGQVAQQSAGLAQAQRVLERVGESTGESVNLGIQEGLNVLVLIRVESQQALRFNQEPGCCLAWHATSMGKALVAFGRDPEGDVSRATETGPLERFTATTLAEPDELVRELRSIKLRGYSVDNEESLAGVRCVGAPVLDASGNARAAIAVQAPAIRMPDIRIEPLARQLQVAAREVATVMGLDVV